MHTLLHIPANHIQHTHIHTHTHTTCHSTLCVTLVCDLCIMRPFHVTYDIMAHPGKPCDHHKTDLINTLMTQSAGGMHLLWSLTTTIQSTSTFPISICGMFLSSFAEKVICSKVSFAHPHPHFFACVFYSIGA